MERIFNKDRRANSIKRVWNIAFKMKFSSLLKISTLSLILLIAFTVRLLPIRWGLFLSEFDPYFHYRSAEYMVKNGIQSWYSWIDYARWHPFGNSPMKTSYPGLAITASFLYSVFDALGFSTSLSQLCILFPVVMGTITCLVMYFLCKDIGGSKAALFSSFFLALNMSYIGRTSLGFFDDESVGIFSILLFLFFFLRAIEVERTFRDSLVYALGSGLVLGYLCASWGASRYVIGLTALFVFILILARRYSQRLFFSYSISFGVAFLIAINVPKLGLSFLIETFNLPVIGVFFLLLIYEISRRFENLRTKTAIIFVFLAVGLIGSFFLMEYGFIKATPGKFLAALNPFQREETPLVASVAEHRPGGWGSFYYEYGVGIFFIPLGLFFCLQNPTDKNILVILFSLTTVYFASSMLRLTLIMAPAFCLLWGIALVRLSNPFVTIIRERGSRQRRIQKRINIRREFGAIFLIILFLLLTFTFVLPRGGEVSRPISNAYIQTTIAAGALPIRPDVTVTDWLDALSWMRDNLPQSAVVASWWDYGYWITVIGNKTTIVDNGTGNMTQIGTIGLMFISEEDKAIEILEKYGTTHVVVFTSFAIDFQTGKTTDMGWGDDGKWRWMHDIADSVFPDLNLKDVDMGKYETDPSTGRSYWSWSQYGQNTTIYKLIDYGKQARVSLLYDWQPTNNSLTHFELIHVSKGPLIYGTYLSPVCIYEVK